MERMSAWRAMVRSPPSVGEPPLALESLLPPPPQADRVIAATAAIPTDLIRVERVIDCLIVGSTPRARNSGLAGRNRTGHPLAQVRGRPGQCGGAAVDGLASGVQCCSDRYSRRQKLPRCYVHYQYFAHDLFCRTATEESDVERTALTLDTLPGDPLEIPYARVTGRAGEGPRLTVVAGVHGTEYTGMAALMRLIGQLDPEQLRGTLTVVPVLNQLAFWSRTPFVVPADGKNLNRAFPGDPAGSYTDALAHELFEAFIRPSDVLLDLHAGDLPEALEPFCLYEESPVEDRARELALVYGTGHVVRQSAAVRTV